MKTSLRSTAVLSTLTVLLAAAAPPEARAANPVVRFHTSLGDIDVVLLKDTAPLNVANFLSYVNRRDYDNTFIHRSIANFVIQGGGYKFENNNTYLVLEKPPVVNEFHVSNTRGTLAMAKLSGNPDSATCQWFFNLSDVNAPNLDTQNGGYTVFGRILGTTGLAMLDTWAALPVYHFGGPFDDLPLKDYNGTTVTNANLLTLFSVREVAPRLTVTKPPAGGVTLGIQASPGTSYPIESSTTLLPGSFSLRGSVMTDASGFGSYQDLDPNPGPRRFYRLLAP